MMKLFFKDIFEKAVFVLIFNEMLFIKKLALLFKDIDF